jgi:hypothetical protein
MATAGLATNERIDEIQRRMAAVRHDLHQEVQGAVKSAQRLTDWRSLVRSHPWLALGAAMVGGYFIVPRPKAESALALGQSSAERDRGDGPRKLASAQQTSRWSVVAMTWGLLAPVAIRAAQNYVAYHLENWLLSDSHRPSGAGPVCETRESAGPATILFGDAREPRKVP